MIVQIYGITTPEDARVVVDAGADHVGVVLEEGYGTWDAVDATTARTILDELAGVTTVALSLATDESDSGDEVADRDDILLTSVDPSARGARVAEL